MAASIKFFPFGPGLHQENDNRLQNAGAPRAIENLVRTKNGRLKPRRDYETLGMTAQTGVTALELYDLHTLGSRVLGLGKCTLSSSFTYPAGSADIFELVEEPQNVWQRVPTSALGVGAHARLLGRIGRKPSSVERLDIAAGGGRICIVYEMIMRPDTGSVKSVGVVIIDAATDATLQQFQILSDDRPRVCFCGGKFFITAVFTANGAIELYVYDPAVSTALTSLSNVASAGASVVAYDLGASIDQNTFWCAIARSDTTTQLRGMNSSGTVTYTTAGPAVLADAISVLHHTASGTDRLHICIVRDTTLNIDLHTYLPPATTPAISTLNILTPFDSLSQVGLCVSINGVSINLFFQSDATGTMLVQPVNFTTHGLTGLAQIAAAFINSKAMAVLGRSLTATYIQEEVGFFTHALLRICDTLNQDCTRPVAVIDRFLGHALDRVHLPSIAQDASTGLTYWIMSTEDEDRTASPTVLELNIAGTQRRQTVQLGDVLYMAGAIMQAFDGRHAHEAGGFLTRPFISSTAPSATVGSLDSPDSIYQTIVVQEARDAKNRRIQSAPSNLVEQNLPTQTSMTVVVQRSLTLRDTEVADNFTAITIQIAPTVAIYRTLNTVDGNGTFHLDQSIPSPRQALKTQVSATLIQSDVDISDNSILYTQGARGALSGPLEFVCPDPCTTLAASADHILSGGLPEETRIQESRPLFVAEQVQWSDTLGFYRDTRDRVLAVARLDERRIAFTATELFEMDGPGVDDNGLGEIGAPRRLPSDVGLYGGVLGWRSLVEISAGILFQGLSNQIYLLPRGGVTPIPIGFAIEDTLALYPDISSAVYMNEDQTVRFTCNNTGGTESIILLFNVRFTEWYVEGPYAFGIRAATKASGRYYLVTTANTVLRQRTSDVPLAFVAHAWRAGIVHPFTPGMMGRVFAFWFYGTYRGNCQIRAIARWDDGSIEEHDWVDVVGLTVGSQFVFRFEFDQSKCESCTVDYEVRSFQSELTEGIQFNYWAIESEPSGVPNEVGPEQMT